MGNAASVDATADDVARTSARELDLLLGAGREAVKYGNENMVYADYSAKAAVEMADKMHDELMKKVEIAPKPVDDTYDKSGRRRKKQIEQIESLVDEVPPEPAKEATWRDRVAHAQKVAARALMMKQALGVKATASGHLMSSIPSEIAENLGPVLSRFGAAYDTLHALLEAKAEEEEMEEREAELREEQERLEQERIQKAAAEAAAQSTKDKNKAVYIPERVRLEQMRRQEREREEAAKAKKARKKKRRGKKKGKKKKKAAAGEEQAAEGAAPAAEAAPAEGEAKPAEGGEKPAESAAAPAESAAAPDESAAAPAESAAAPSEGEVPPSEGEVPPSAGEAAPAEEEAKDDYETHLLNDDEMSALLDEQVSVEEVQAMAQKKLEEERVKREAMQNELEAKAAYAEIRGTLLDPDVRTCVDMVNVYLNVANAAPLENILWEMPHIYNIKGWEKQSLKEADSMRSIVIQSLKKGYLCIHMMATEEGVFLKDGKKTNIYSSCPYELARLLTGFEEVVMGDFVEGAAIGSRQIANLVCQVADLAGKEAVRNLKLILTVTHDAEAFVKADMAAHGFYGLDPHNVLLYLLPALPGFVWDTESRCFNCDLDSPMRIYGSGYAMNQLCWEKEGFKLTADGHVVALPCSGFEWMHEKGVEWMQVTKIEDAYQMQPNMALDVSMLGHTMFQHQTTGAVASIEAEEVKYDAELYQSGSIILRKAGQNPTFSNEVKTAAMLSSTGQSTIERLRKSGKTFCTSSDRYMFHVHSLAKVLSSSRFDFTMSVEGQEEMNTKNRELIKSVDLGDTIAIYPHADMSDITLKMRTVAAFGDKPQCEIKDARCAHQLVAIAKALDGHPGFRSVISNVKGDSAVAKALQKSFKPRVKVLAACGADVKFGSSHRAVALMEHFLHPTEDKVTLLNVCNNLSDQPSAQRLLSTLEPENKQINCQPHVLTSGQGLASTIQDYAEDNEYDLIVMGSEQLAANPMGAVGSMALAVCRTAPCSFFLLKGNVQPKPMLKTNDAGTEKKTTKLTWVVVLSPTSHNKTLDFAVQFMDTKNHRLVLHMIEPKSKSKDAESILNTFQARAEGFHNIKFVQTRHAVAADMAKFLVNVTQQERTDMLVLAAPLKAGDNIPPAVVDCMRGVNAPILVHRF